MRAWNDLRVASCGTFHQDTQGRPAYATRFGEVLKFHSPGLAPVKLGDDAWHIHPDGSPAYERRFKRTFGFYESKAAAQSTGGWLHIDQNGEAVYDGRYAWCGNFQKQRCPVRGTGGEYWHINSKGQPAYLERWRYAGDYRDGIAVVQNHEGYSTHINRDGEHVHSVWFIDLDVFHKLRTCTCCGRMDACRPQRNAGVSSPLCRCRAVLQWAGAGRTLRRWP